MKIRFPVFENDHPETPFEFIIAVLLVLIGIASVTVIFVASLITFGPAILLVYMAIVLAIAFYKGYIKIEI